MFAGYDDEGPRIHHSFVNDTASPGGRDGVAGGARSPAPGSIPSVDTAPLAPAPAAAAAVAVETAETAETAAAASVPEQLDSEGLSSIGEERLDPANSEGAHLPIDSTSESTAGEAGGSHPEGDGAPKAGAYTRLRFSSI